MRQRVRIPATREGKRFGTRRFGLPRALTALVLLGVMLVGMHGTARGAHCARRNAVAASVAHQQSISAIDLHRAAPDQQVPSRDSGLPTPSQGCTSAIALPVSAMIPMRLAFAQAPPLEHAAAPLAMHEPPTLFRPPRA